jgi:beta-glucosidase
MTIAARLQAEPTLADVTAYSPEFRWGFATAAYQIEGAATEGGRGASIWDTFAATPGRTFHGDSGDIACDHYHRWEGDLDLLADLGVADYRLSVSWSRLQPRGEGDLNPEAVTFYRALLTGLRTRGITRSSRSTTGTCRNRSRMPGAGRCGRPLSGSPTTRNAPCTPSAISRPIG